MIIRTLIRICLILLLLVSISVRIFADWNDKELLSRGQTVYFNAWGGSEEINTFLHWVAVKVQKQHGVELIHVKLSNTADAVSRILAEKIAGRKADGSVDLIWINGENFKIMKENGLLYGPFTEFLPNFALVDTVGKPTTVLDFHVPVEGLEAPWGMAKFNFVFDSARVSRTPETMPELLDWAENHPGRFTYPQVTDFLGSTFLLQTLMELTPDPAILRNPVLNERQFERVTAPLWDFLGKLHPNLWRKGRSFPENNSRLRQMLNDSEVDISLSFNPADTSSAIANGSLPRSARTFVLKQGTIGNTHFVAIPFNSSAKEGAMVVADFLLSPEAQARKQDPSVWGDGTVLDMKRLNQEDRTRFSELPLGIATLPPDKLGPTQPHPHPDWKNRIDEEWLRRYGQ